MARSQHGPTLRRKRQPKPLQFATAAALCYLGLATWTLSTAGEFGVDRLRLLTFPLGELLMILFRGYVHWIHPDRAPVYNLAARTFLLGGAGWYWFVGYVLGSIMRPPAVKSTEHKQ